MSQWIAANTYSLGAFWAFAMLLTTFGIFGGVREILAHIEKLRRELEARPR